jgi:peptidoglycan/LPS O-acetylase OafA/YrhL
MNILGGSSMLQETKNRFVYLDGLRGLAALYVVLHHAYFEINPNYGTAGLSKEVLMLAKPLVFGRFSVDIFIVLSGFCLMLPVLRSATGSLRGGLIGYLKRRAWRILPPYYAALGLSLLLIVLVPGLQQTANVHWDVVLPAFDTDTLLSHLLLVHNLSPDWAYKINHVFWSVATEWQIYFIFALVLLPAWQRFGPLAAVSGAFAIGLLPHYLFDGWLDSARFWYLGLFALGMIAAEVSVSSGKLPEWLRTRIPWATLSILLFALVVAATLSKWTIEPWLTDTIVGASTACILIFCSWQVQKSHPHLLLRFLELPWIVMMGEFSYSLYLTHAPVLALVHIPLLNNHYSSDTRLLLLCFIATPLSVLVAYLFHRVFELPFLYVKRERKAANLIA